MEEEMSQLIPCTKDPKEYYMPSTWTIIHTQAG